MMLHRKLILVCLVLAVQIPFLSFSELADEISDPSLSEARKICLLLADPRVQADLGLTSNQVMQIQTLQRVRAEDIVGLSNLLAKVREAEVSNRVELVEQVSRTADEHRLAMFFAVLTSSQSNELRATMLQMHGLMSLVEIPELTSAFGLSEDQVRGFAEIQAYYAPLLNVLRRRLGRQRIAGLRGDETMHDRTAEVESLQCVIRAVKRDMERDLWDVLTESQRKKWLNITASAVRLDNEERARPKQTGSGLD
jgi:hypothetical protein